MKIVDPDFKMWPIFFVETNCSTRSIFWSKRLVFILRNFSWKNSIQVVKSMLKISLFCVIQNICKTFRYVHINNSTKIVVLYVPLHLRLITQRGFYRKTLLDSKDLSTEVRVEHRLLWSITQLSINCEKGKEKVAETTDSREEYFHSLTYVLLGYILLSQLS